MGPNQEYTAVSLELHLFFSRIMKEHSLFIMASLTPANRDFTKAAEHYKTAFEKILWQAVNLSCGVVGKEVLNSGEIVTSFTLGAEEQTQYFTGIPINTEITEQEMHLSPGFSGNQSPGLHREVKALNREATDLLDGLISLKEDILSHVLHCRMFTMNYPLLIEHIIREAKLYRMYLRELEETGHLEPQTMAETETFWNRIMMEHALFIRGLLDPTENALIHTADDFAKDYKALLESSHAALEKTLDETIRLRDFKQAATEGIQECKIRSVILPLLADHVLREANHYLRLLKK